MAVEEDDRRARIAVIAVHGVADQAPAETAHAVAGLLGKRSYDEARHQYTSFDETKLSIPHRSIKVEKDEVVADKDSLSRLQSLNLKCEKAIGERPQYVIEAVAQEQALEHAPIPPEHRFMIELLDKYAGEGPGATYDSILLTGERLSPNGDRGPSVHIYEMYWADLSRLGSGLTQIFTELYQLLFHFGSLGLQTVDLASLAAGNVKSRLWAAFSFSQRWAVRALTWPIPILNLLGLATVLAIVPLALPEWFQPIIGLGLPATVLAFLYSYFCYRSESRTPLFLWMLVPFVWSALISAIVYAILKKPIPSDGRYHIVLGIEWCAIAIIGLWWIIKQYEMRRPGARLMGYLLGVPTFLLLIALIITAAQTREGVIRAVFYVIEWIYLGMSIFWMLFYLLQICAAVAGWLAVRRLPKDQPEARLHHNRVARAALTARITLAVPAILFLLVTLLFWRSLAWIGDYWEKYLFPSGLNYSPQTFLLSRLLGDACAVDQPAMKFLDCLVVASATPALAIALLLIGLALIVAICSFAPGVIAEIRPPRKGDEESKTSRRLGEWLNRGYQYMRFAGELIFYATAVVLPAGASISLLNYERLDWVQNLTGEVVTGIGTLLTATAAGVLVSGAGLKALSSQWLTLRAILKRLSLGFRPALDVVLDVDNYLRLHPVEANPRSRICARYASLLRHISTWKDTDGSSYDAILIVSHSQGTVITADLLRFLQWQLGMDRHLDDALARLGNAPDRGELPVYLLTFGCPLRQLYSLRFPHLYQWARHVTPRDERWKENDPRHIPNDQFPDPSSLGVEVWMNAFRSGDFVGRQLWRADLCDYQWNHPGAATDPDAAWMTDLDRLVRVTSDDRGLRREFCIGPGAHTHYLDETAPEIAAAIDYLILRSTEYRVPSAEC